MEAEAVTMARISVPRRNDQSAEGRSCMAAGRIGDAGALDRSRGAGRQSTQTTLNRARDSAIMQHNAGCFECINGCIREPGNDCITIYKRGFSTFAGKPVIYGRIGLYFSIKVIFSENI